MNIINSLFLAFSCLALGYYVGYLLFYRDRSSDEKRQKDLTRENENVRHSLKLAHQSYTKLDSQFARQTGQLKTLQTLCDDWTDSRRQADQERGELEEALRAKSDRITEIQADLTAEKQTRIDLEDAQHRLLQEFSTNVADIDETWRKNQSKAEAAFSKLETQYASVDNEKKQIAEKLKAAEIQVAQMQSELASQQVMLATATNNAQGLEQEYVSIEAAMADNKSQLQAAIEKCTVAESARVTAEDSIANLDQELKDLRGENERLVEQVIELEALKPQVDTLNETVQSATERLTSVVGQRDQAMTAEAAAKNVSSGLQQRIDNQETTIHRLRTKYEQSMEDLKQEIDRRAQVETELQESVAAASERQTSAMLQLTDQRDQLADQLKAAEFEMANLLANHQNKIDSLVVESDGLNSKYAAICEESGTLAKQCEELTGLCEDRAGAITKLENEHEEYLTQIISLTEERDRLTDQIADLTNQRNESSDQVAALTGQHDEFSEKIASLTSERDGLRAQLDQVEERLGVSVVELKASRETVANLKTETEDLKITCQRIGELEALVQSRDINQSEMTGQLEKLRTAYQEASETNKTLQAELDALQTQWDDRLESSNHKDREIRTLQTKVRASEETIRSLRRERAAVLARLANYRTIAEPEAKVISFTEAMELRSKRDTNYDDEYGGPVRMHATRGLIYTQAPKESDDLKRISGIAVVLEARLNDYGVYTFKQIMEWKPEAIEEFSHLLTFKDRIERDDWISQARFFYNEKQRVSKTYAA